jgi:hypothetical protein
MKLSNVLRYELLTESNKAAYVADALGAKLAAAIAHDSSANEIHRLPPEQQPQAVVNVIREADPTKGADALVWLARMYTRGLFKIEDLRRVKQDLTVFFANRAKIANKDLNSYKSMEQLYDVTEPFTQQEAPAQSKRAEKQAIKKGGAKYLINTPKFKAIQLLTHEAACYYGANTKWCTAAADDSTAFDEYTEEGPIFVIIASKPGDTKPRKFQFHVESGQFMDERDVELKKSDIKFLSSFPEYADFLNILIKKHYFPND